MLVLSRKQDEELIIRDDLTGAVIRIQVVAILGGNRVKIGIDASDRFTVLRPEVHSIRDFRKPVAKHGATAAGNSIHHIPPKFLP
jgi:carbon storage regulator CsrA